MNAETKLEAKLAEATSQIDNYAQVNPPPGGVNPLASRVDSPGREADEMRASADLSSVELARGAWN
eukprot:7938117-Pyramimonas_sp.AAC.3